MKKILLTLLSVIFLCTLASCVRQTSTGSSLSPSLESDLEPPVTGPSPETQSSENTAASKEATRISITVGNHTLYANLDDSELAGEFVSLLPQTISMSRVGGGREFYGPLQGSLHYDEADVQTTFENGDVAYWFSGNGLCLLYNNQVEEPEIESGIIVFGQIISDLSVLHELSNSEEMTVALAE